MKKIVIGLVALVVVGAGVYFGLVKKDDNKSASSSSSQTASSSGNDSYSTISDACSFFTLTDAQKVLGSSAEKGGDTSAGNVSTSDLAVSSCTYLVKAATQNAVTVQNQPESSILVRSAKSKTGADSNKAQFGAGKPAGVQDVSGYGDAAYWNPQFGQLNVLAHNNWYILSNGTLKVANRTLEDGKKLADALNSKF